MEKGLDGNSYEESLRSLGVFSLEETSLLSQHPPSGQWRGSWDPFL